MSTAKENQPQRAAEGNPPVADRTRRRLVVGASSALPTVLTLHSGAAHALASNLQCFAKSPGGATAFSTVDDGWRRHVVATGTYRVTSVDHPAYCVYSPNITPTTPPDALNFACRSPTNATWAVGGSKWYVPSLGQEVTVGSGTAVRMGSTVSYGLIYTDQTGSIQTLQPSLRNLPTVQETSDSCWNSMMPSGTNVLG
jgi:hypothetical protein